MPEIPESPGQKVFTEPVDKPTAPQVDVSSGLKSLAGAVEKVVDVASELKKKNDKTRAQDASLEYDRMKNEILFAPETGYYNTLGQSAVEGMRPTEKALKDLAKRISGEMRSPEARRAFDEYTQVSLNKEMSGIYRHGAKGQLTWETANVKANVENSVDNAYYYYDLTNPAHGEKLNNYYTLGEQHVIKSLELQGLSPDGEIGKEAMDNFRASFIQSAVNGALAGNEVELAKLIKEKYKLELEEAGQIGAEINKAISNAEKKNTIFAEVDRIYADGTKPEAEMNKEIRQVDAQYRAEVDRQVKNMVASEKSAIDAQQKEDYNTYDLMLDQYPAFTTLNIPEDVWETLTPEMRNALRKKEDKKASGEDIVTDWPTYYMIAEMPVEQLKTYDITQHYSDLAGKERRGLEKLKSDARLGKLDPDDTEVQTRGKIVSRTINQLLGHKYNDRLENDRQLAKDYTEILQQRITAFEKTLPRGKEMTPEDFNRINNEVVSGFPVEKFFGFIEEEITLADIPTKYRPIVVEWTEQRFGEEGITGKNLALVYRLADRKGTLEKEYKRRQKENVLELTEGLGEEWMGTIDN